MGQGLKKIGVTMGDPAGIGPEIIARLLMEGSVFNKCIPVFYGDGEILHKAVKLLGGECIVGKERIELGAKVAGFTSVPSPEGFELEPGRLSSSGSVVMMECVKRATLDAAEGKVSAVVTCPITKEGIRLAGYDYPGHTEFIRDLVGGNKVVMMLAGERLKVALVTIHLSLKKALASLSETLIYDTIEVVNREFRDKMRIREPKIAVAGVNPHAGEGGLFGTEEEEMVLPAILRAKGEGMDVQGPFPPDTVFYRAAGGEFHVVVSMYHDQGLIPLKLLHFDDGVNVTLGLPIVRTSVDHGTAYDIAWKGKARETSLAAAVDVALSMTGGI